MPLIRSSDIKALPWRLAISPCNQVAAQLARNGSIFFWPTKLTTKPLRTSPDPITANSEDEWSCIAIFLSCETIIVLGPFNIIFDFTYFAALKAWSIMFWFLFIWGNILENSPACGVIILFLSSKE